MESHILNQLAEKFWEGKSTEQEEQQLKESLLQGPVPPELNSLAEYLQSLEAYRSATTLDQEFDAQMLAKIQPPAPVRSLKSGWAMLTKIAAGIVLLLGMAWGIQTMTQPQEEEIVSEFVDTFEDSEIAYQEVKKALLIVSANMNEGLEHAELLGEFHKVKSEVENKK
ncbi:MAG: hypothetical protein AAF587_17350 [Bacteroidota bacterium]